MIHLWKLPHLAKGVLTYVPVLNALRLRRGTTGGSDSARYCYAVWLRHLVLLDRYGFRVEGAAVGELGPGDTIGTGIAALLSGADTYIGLDVVPYSAHADLPGLARQLAELYARHEPIPDHHEFPAVRPRLPSYAFPHHLVALGDMARKIRAIDAACERGLRDTPTLSYRAPWQSRTDVHESSLDLLFSQAVLQYIDDLDGLYAGAYAWLKAGGFCSHATGLGANNFSPHWNGHWAYTDTQWRIVRGRREWLPNRRPLSHHLTLAARSGLRVVHVEPQFDEGGLPVEELAAMFRQMPPDDLHARGAMIVLQKPGHVQ